MTQELNSSFQSWRSFWNFQREVLRDRRFVRSAEADAFLQCVSLTCEARKKRLKSGTVLWRAQRGHAWREIEEIADSIPCALPKDRMKPLVDRAREGRVNPKGIPCLYLATRADTAMSEVRPWIGSYVSLAQFRVTRDLMVIDCSLSADRIWLHLEEPSPSRREETVWAHIDRAFSEPAEGDDDRAEYAATQILAELFRSLGCDGVVYRSALDKEGLNVALFDLSSARLLNCSLNQARAAKFEFAEADGPYFVKES